MTPLPSTNGSALPTLIRFPDFNVSWAGEGPHTGWLCFGSEDGKLRMTTTEGLVGDVQSLAVESNEAINGAAFLGRFWAMSTRSEVVLFTRPATKDEKYKRAVFPAGAHGVIATSAGQFVAPLGRTGLLVWKPELGDEQHPKIRRAIGEHFYNFYRVLSLNAASRSELLVCATRSGGVTVTPISPLSGETEINSYTFPGQDVIDVCALDTGSGGLAVAALGCDCTLVFFRDVQRDNRPITLKFNGVQGTAYNLLSARGHLFLLTSRGLYVLRGLAKRFLNGEPVDSQPTAVSEIPLEAVDANLVHDRWLLVVMADHTLLYDVEQLVGPESDGAEYRNGQSIVPTAQTPTWQSRVATWATATDLAPLSTR
jgi:hypothetical protein